MSVLDLKPNLGATSSVKPHSVPDLKSSFKILIALDDHSIDVDETNSEVNSEATSLGFAKSWKGAVNGG